MENAPALTFTQQIGHVNKTKRENLGAVYIKREGQEEIVLNLTAFLPTYYPLCFIHKSCRACVQWLVSCYGNRHWDIYCVILLIYFTVSQGRLCLQSGLLQARHCRWKGEKRIVIKIFYQLIDQLTDYVKNHTHLLWNVLFKFANKALFN